MLALTLLAFAILRGMHSVITKITQKNFVSGFDRSVYFTVVYSFLQGLTLLAMTPYYHYKFELKMLFNPFFYAVFFITAYVLYIYALGKGPNSLTNVISSFGMLIPIIAGLILWKESITLYEVIGLILFAVIILLFNRGSYNDGSESKPISSQWVILAVGSAVAGGTSVIFTKQHMITYSNAIYEYLVAFNAVVVAIGLPYLLWAVKFKKFKPVFDKKFLIGTALIALIQNINNIIFMFYVNRFSSAYFFPLINILNIISVVVMSRIVLKEKISRAAYLGILLSLVAIYLLNIK